MTEPTSDDSSIGSDSMGRMLNRGFAAAGDAAKRDSAPPAPSVIQRLGELIGQQPTVSLSEVDATADEPMLKPLADADGVASQAGKYSVQGMLGQGGVGAVHKGHDSDLGRDVALKFLHERYRDQPEILQRFVEEAQIGGQLQHPGIVPVYELGIVDGRPFFAMKMVKGRTLAQRLAERESIVSDRRALLAVFEDICQTMSYAHARGVVHRDLKPANVMIGSFGEVQVVDWGMGKVLVRGGIADEKLAHECRSEDPLPTVIETVRTGDHGSRSVMGSVMGTPAYMPPEQARGDVDGMNARSDVFALGAILCEILTGKPPYIGEQADMLRQAALGDLDDARARLRACGAEPDLIKLAESCLMPSPAGRPRSAELVARSVHDHLAAVEQRVHDARVEAAEATAREASLRRAQKFGIVLTAVIAAGLLASLWFWREADAQRTRAHTSLQNFDRLSHVVLLDAAKDTAELLYPAWPERTEAMRAWLEGDAQELQAALPELRATLATLRARAGSAPANDAAPVQFADGADQFLFDTLTELAVEIEQFVAADVASVGQRLAWSQRVQELTIERHRAKWEAARRAILAADGVTASTRYASQRLDLKPQLGLVPIGMNPDTKLWEFYHLRSAWNPELQSDPGLLEPPVYGADGRLDVDGKGIVFVLLPGGTYRMGAQRNKPDEPSYDRFATKNEGPVHEVTLAPYFLAKHELTQGQWARLSGGEWPSWYKQEIKYAGVPEVVGDDHPVEQVSWSMCDQLLQRHGLLLPTEAQWEHGCRAGSITPWAMGDEPTDLDGFANILDQSGERVPPAWPGGEAFDDRHKGPAPVGTYRANAFGLHDMHGNVWEWCRDRYGDYLLPVQPGDGLRQAPSDSQDRVYRGGGFRVPAAAARAPVRDRVAATVRTSELGVRVARRVAH